MISRNIAPRVTESLMQFPAVALLGPRQVGKSTLARSIAGEAVFLDLERPADQAKLQDAESYLGAISDRLVVIDEIQRMPELFPVLRFLIDKQRRPGRFLLLGSASPALRRQSAESLAGRIEYLELTPFTLDEVGATPENLKRLLLRGGFPESYLATSDKASLRWRQAFIQTFLEQDIPLLGIRIPASQLRRFWQMLAHLHGKLWNASQIAASMGVNVGSVRHYLDILADTFMVRVLPPYHANLGKRLVKSPKTYLRDTGLLHSLLGIGSYDDLLSHPVVGASWEGLVIEHLVGHAEQRSQAFFYRTAAGAELDLVIDSPSDLHGYEVKFGLAPKLSKGYHHAIVDLGIDAGRIIYTGEDQYRLSGDAIVTSLAGVLGVQQ